jgi:hypothetical protein
VPAALTTCLALPRCVSPDFEGTHHGSRDRDRLLRCFPSRAADPFLRMVDLPFLDAAGRPGIFGTHEPLLPSRIRIDRRAPNAPVSGAAAEPRTDPDRSPRPVHWRVRRRAVVQQEPSSQRATLSRDPMSHDHPTPRRAADRPGDATRRQPRHLRRPRWSADRRGAPGCSASLPADPCPVGGRFAPPRRRRPLGVLTGRTVAALGHPKCPPRAPNAAVERRRHAGVVVPPTSSAARSNGWFGAMAQRVRRS